MNKREWISILGITTACVFLLTLGFIADWIRTQPGNIYLGTIHYAPDYFNYISWIVQGENNILSSALLYTAENVPKNLSRWEFVLLGFILTKFGFGPIGIYHVGVFLFRILFFIASYLVLRLIFPDSRLKRILSFFLFASSTAWPIVEISKQGLDFGYHYFWYNTGNFFSRFGPTPNHLLASALLAFSFFFYLLIIGRLRILYKRHLLLLSLSGFLLASISPIFWVLVLGAGLIAGIRGGFKLFVPLVVYFFGGVFPAFYIQEIYKTIPYSTILTWESYQRLPMDFISFFYANGPVSLFAILGIFPFIKSLKHERIFGLIFIIICFTLFVSKLHFSLGIMNVRFWPQAIYIFIAAVATEGIIFISSFFKKWRVWVIITIILIYASLTAASYLGQLEDDLVAKTNDRGLIYLPKDVYETYHFAKKNTSAESIFLVRWPYNESFPAITGRRVYYGDPISHMTIDGNKKTQEALQILDGVLTEVEAKDLIQKNNISHILAAGGGGFEKYTFIKKIYERENISLYELKL